jgi:hypothetical protein
MALHLIRSSLLLWAFLGLCGPVLADEKPASPAAPDVTGQPDGVTGAGTRPAPGTMPRDPLAILAAEIERLEKVVEAQRQELAQARLEAAEAWRKLDELREFIRDNEQLGRDFGQYRAVKAVAEREARMARAQAARQRREAEREAQQRKREEARAERDKAQDESERLKGYHDQGFMSLGFDVFLANMAFNYPTVNGGPPARLDWDFRLGHYLRFYPRTLGWGRQIDFSTMTISGSVLNASNETRNIGIAVTFFDERGSQVGGEIVQINNARPDVPYPFTTTISMALNRAFSSATAYVLYGDPVELAATP